MRDRLRATALIVEERDVTAADTLTLRMAPGGGAAACFAPARRRPPMQR